MGVKNTEESLVTFKETHNTVEDLFNKQELEKYQTLDFPANVELLNRTLKAKLKEDPTYEVWVPVSYFTYELTSSPKENKQFTTRYVMVSNKGNLHHLRKQTKAITGNLNEGGYLKSQVRLTTEVTHFAVHRAVGSSFIPLPDNLKHLGYNALDINHKDTIKTHNDFTNLEWCTRAFNVQHAVNNGLRTYIKGAEHYAVKPVLGEVWLEGPYKGFKFIRSGKEELESSFGPITSSVFQACLGNLKQSKGCKWSYATPEDIAQYADTLIPKELVTLIRNQNSNWKAPIIGTRLEDGHLLLIKGGPKEITDLGFSYQSVYSSCSGSVNKPHKGYNFRRAVDDEEVKLIEDLISKQTTEHVIPGTKQTALILALRVTDHHRILLKGAKEIIAAGFEKSSVYDALKRPGKVYKGYTFSKIETEFDIEEQEWLVAHQQTVA